MTSLRVIAVVVTLLSVAACDDPAPRTTPSSAPSSTPAPSAAALAYEYSDLDLCDLTDLAPLAELNLTVQDEKRTVPAGRRQGEGEVCLFEMKTQDGQIARLTVEAIPAKSLDEAQAIYRAACGELKPDGDIAGLGDRAEACTLDTEVGYKHSEHLVHLSSDNLHVTVWLAVGGDSYTPKQTLAPKTKAIAQATLKTVSRAWK